MVVPSAMGETDEDWRFRTSAGRVSPLYEMRVVADDGSELPTDGVSVGELEIRGPMVASSYLDLDVGESHFRDGWLRTGDVGTIDENGWMRITDRLKDAIKSGGEWISSVDLESALMAHPAVREAAVVGRPDERWGERPAAFVVTDGAVGADELRAHLVGRVAKWWIPDDFRLAHEHPADEHRKVRQEGPSRSSRRRGEGSASPAAKPKLDDHRQAVIRLADPKEMFRVTVLDDYRESTSTSSSTGTKTASSRCGFIPTTIPSSFWCLSIES